MTSDRRVFVADDSFDGERLDVFLCESLDFSRSHIQKLIKSSNVTIDDTTATKPGYRIKACDEISIIIPPPEHIETKPENLNLDIVYEDDDIIVVDKPKGMVVHPAPGHMEHTLVNGLLYHCGESLSGINGILRPGIVHRIDRDTTGLLVVCKNDSAHIHLAKQFAKHSITRRYQAIVYNNFSSDEGMVDAPLGRNPANRKKMAVVSPEKGRRAVTHYRACDHLNRRFNHIELTLETGRTHQIRVHMAYIRHPVLGDEVYGPKPDAFSKGLQGQTLHAGVLGFIHPGTGQYMEFSSPLPQYFKMLKARLAP